VWISGLLIVGSLLAVVVGDSLVTQGPVRLSTTEGALAAAVAKQKTLQIAVAMKAAPPVVVSQAKKQGLVAASQVVYLPQVPLNVPLPPPRIVPSPAGTATTPATTPPPANAAPSPVSTPAPATPASPATTTPAPPATTTPASSTTPATPATTPATTAAGAQ
jgi:hypothetical protein